MTPLLEVRSLQVSGRRRNDTPQMIVNDVSFTVNPGEIVALIGESGAGKTTLALAALGYCRPGTQVVRGSAFFKGADLFSMSALERRKIRGGHIAYVAQSAQAALNPVLTVGDQIAEPILLHEQTNREVANRRAVQLMALLDLPEPEMLFRRFPHQLSGGQQQRIMLAMAMATNPDLVILDEPTTALDVTTQLEVLRAIRDTVRHLKSAAIYVSHDLAVVAQLAHRILVLKDGMIVEQGDARTIISAPANSYTKQLLSAVPTKPNHGREKIKLSVSTDASGGAAAEVVLLKVSNISAGYTQTSRVLQDISFEIRSGEAVAVVGESGSGKSTLARVIAGLHQASAGRISFQERPLPELIKRRSLQDLRRIQIVFQSPEQSLNPEHRVSETIGRPLDLYFQPRRAERDRRIRQLLDMVGLPAEYADKFPAELSGGQRQRVSLARAFAADPQIIICDEVLASLDTVVAASILKLMRQLQRQTGVAYLFISHDLATVSNFADRVVVLFQGSVYDAGPAKSVFAPPCKPYTARLLAAIPELRTDWLDQVLAGNQHVCGRESADNLMRSAPCDRD